MAKELPYFKFEPNQWENGNIQICSREDKGLFMDLCSMYWSRLGDLPLKLAINKLCAGNATAFDSLIQEKIFTVIDGLICIDFLNEQLDEFDGTSKKNSENAKIGWVKRRQIKEESERNAVASNSQCQTDAIREDKKRVKKIKEEEDNITPTKVDDINFDVLLKSINETFGRSFKVVNDKVKKAYRVTLKHGYTKAQIWQAIQNAKNAPFHIENNYQYCTVEYFSRPKTIDLFSQTSEVKKAFEPIKKIYD